jgi:CRP/FNR family transcriptional regulator, cyclic AMP receptor protein
MPLSSIFLFKDLSESRLKRITDTVKETRTKKGNWLFHEGHSADRFYALKNGAVELFTRVDEDLELPVTIIREVWGCFGISALVPPYQYSLSSRCAEDADLFVFRREDIEKLTAEDQALGCTIMTNLTQYLLERLKETRQDLKNHFKTLLRSTHT